MKLLLDTHCWLWFLLSPAKLNEKARDLLRSGEAEVYLSVGNAWEIIIKADLGKLELPEPPREYIPDRLEALGHHSLPILQDHVLQISKLPSHHKDPFDRILVAQAQTEGMALVTADEALRLYDAEIIWAR